MVVVQVILDPLRGHEPTCVKVPELDELSNRSAVLQLPDPPLAVVDTVTDCPASIVDVETTGVAIDIGESTINSTGEVDVVVTVLGELLSVTDAQKQYVPVFNEIVPTALFPVTVLPPLYAYIG